MQVRDGKISVVTCPACGCRLEEVKTDLFRHFGLDPERDARGCKCVNRQISFRRLENDVFVREFAG